MPEFITVAKVGAIPEGQGKTFAVGARLIAVFHEAGGYFAIDDACPHMGASLGAAPVESGVVTCPWHDWRFNVRDGIWCDNPRIKITTYRVQVEGDEIRVEVPD